MKRHLEYTSSSDDSDYERITKNPDKSKREKYTDEPVQEEEQQKNSKGILKKTNKKERYSGSSSDSTKPYTLRSKKTIQYFKSLPKEERDM